MSIVIKALKALVLGAFFLISTNNHP